jgi:uncharacterized protein YjbJ (UPF0337 family)
LHTSDKPITGKVAWLAIPPTSPQQQEFDMNRDSIAGNWKQFKGRVKSQWGRLTGHPLEEIDGKRIEVTGKIQEGYGDARDTAEQTVKRND